MTLLVGEATDGRVAEMSFPPWDASDLHDLMPALRRLDHLIAGAVAAAMATFGPDAAHDPYRGLVIRADEVERLLARAPATPTLSAAASSDNGDLTRTSPRFARLGRAFGLTAFDLDTLLVALAPELDLRYERLYAYLQDDVNRRRPSVDLALNLLCASAAERLTRRARFGAEAPLRRHGLLELVQDPNRANPPFLAQDVKLDEQIVRWLLGIVAVDERCAAFARLVTPHEGTIVFGHSTLERTLLVLIEHAGDQGTPIRIGLQGAPGNGQGRLVARLAAARRAPLLRLDLETLLAVEPEPTAALHRCCRDARLFDAILVLENTDVLAGDHPHGLSARLRDLLAEHPGVVILSGEQAWPQSAVGSADLVVAPVEALDHSGRRAAWETALAAANAGLPPDDIDVLASRFRLSLDQIEHATTAARAAARWRGAARWSPDGPAGGWQPTRDDLFRAARAQAEPKLAALALKIEPRYRWADLVLPDDAVAQLHELCGRVNRRERVLAEWGFGRKLSLGRGTNALFAGPSGTGKTMAAEVIANDLGLDLYRIELAGVVSKYIGETEKNLDGIFAAASGANAILFFDEADALFGKRSEVRDAHDRYANIETAYLLQKMEQYDGVAILATNLRGNLDEAFTRRLACTVHFPFPDETNRARIWVGIWPPEVVLAEGVDLAGLARRFPLSGGNIKNIALAAAYLAAESGAAVTTMHLLQAIRREYQKLGKQVTLAELIDHDAADASDPGQERAR